MVIYGFRISRANEGTRNSLTRTRGEEDILGTLCDSLSISLNLVVKLCLPHGLYLPRGTRRERESGIKRGSVLILIWDSLSLFRSPPPASINFLDVTSVTETRCLYPSALGTFRECGHRHVSADFGG